MNHTRWYKQLLPVYIAFIVFLAGFVYVSGFNIATADDYYLLAQVRNHGFWQYQQFIYQHWGGRYTANVLGALFAVSGILLSAYWLHSCLLFMLTAAAIYWLLIRVNQYWLYTIYSKKPIFFTSLLLSVGVFHVQPQPSTTFFWFSSAITYQFSFILLLLQLSVQIVLFSGKKTNLNWLLAIFLVIVINGTNEIAALVQGVLWLIFTTIHFRKTTVNKVWLLVVFVAYAASLMVLLLAPGNTERLAQLQQGSFPVAVAASIIRLVYVYWVLAASPLFIVLTILFVGIGYITAADIIVPKRGNDFIKNLGLLLAIQAILWIIVLLPLLYFSNGSFPERATNLVVSITAVVLLFCSFYLGLQASKIQQVNYFKQAKSLHTFIPILLAVLMLNGNNVRELLLSSVSAPMYASTQKVQQKQLTQKVNGITEVQTYALIWDSLYQNTYQQKPPRKILADWMKQKPSLLFVFDNIEEPMNLKLMKLYHQTDSIRIINK